MEVSIRIEIIKSLEVGKHYHFDSTYNGGGYDWSNLDVFSEPMRFEMQMWLEETSTCGFAVDVSLLRKTEEQLDFTIHAYQTSPAWYSDSLLSFYKLSEGIDLKKYFEEDTYEVRVLFTYLYRDGKYTFELNQSEEAMLLSDENEVYISNDELPQELVGELKGCIDTFRQGLSTPEGFELDLIEISCDDIDSEDVTVYESWHQTYSFNLTTN